MRNAKHGKERVLVMNFGCFDHILLIFNYNLVNKRAAKAISSFFYSCIHNLKHIYKFT